VCQLRLVGRRAQVPFTGPPSLAAFPVAPGAV